MEELVSSLAEYRQCSRTLLITASGAVTLAAAGEAWDREFDRACRLHARLTAALLAAGCPAGITGQYIPPADWAFDAPENSLWVWLRRTLGAEHVALSGYGL